MCLSYQVQTAIYSICIDSFFLFVFQMIITGCSKEANFFHLWWVATEFWQTRVGWLLCNLVIYFLIFSLRFLFVLFLYIIGKGCHEWRLRAIIWTPKLILCRLSYIYIYIWNHLTGINMLVFKEIFHIFMSTRINLLIGKVMNLAIE